MRSTWRAISDTELEEAVLSSLAQRDENASACPLEIARTLADAAHRFMRDCQTSNP